MQKHAHNYKKMYENIYSPIPFKKDEKIYTDPSDVFIPYAEDFPNLHYHNSYEIGICLEGYCLFLSDGNFYSVSKGDIVFILPESKHYSRSLSETSPGKFRFVYLSADLLHHTTMPSEVFTNNHKYIPTVIKKDEHPSASRLLGEIINICTDNSPPEHSVALRLAIIISEAKKHFSKSDRLFANSKNIQAPCSEAIKIAEFLSLHYQENHSAKELANMCHLSESQLRRQFINIYGIPPIAYRNRLRCSIATKLLRGTNLSVAEISAQTGYSCTSCFYRQFYSIYKMSPICYRNMNII